MDDGARATYEAGDSFDCPACGEHHEVRRGGGLEVGGAPAGVDASPYVRCPEAGVVAFPDGRPPPGEAFEDEGEEWP